MQEAHILIVHRITCQVLSASSDFYAFIGKRFYHALSDIVYTPEIAEFRRQLTACSGAIFPLRLIREDGSSKPYLASAVSSSKNPENALLTLYDAAMLIPTITQQNKEITIKNTQLSLYNDEHFSYSAATGKIRITRMDKYEQLIVETDLHYFFERLRKNATVEDGDAVEKFISDFQRQKPTMHLLSDNNLLEHDGAEVTLIKGLSLFDRGLYTGAAGIIHFGSHRKETVDPQMHRDPLTGLLSKSEITSIAINLIDTRKTKGTCICIVDIDHFKQVNDTFGHMTGDEVIKRVAAILLDQVGSRGLVGRIGGDEFMVIYLHVENMENHRELLRSIRTRVEALYAPEQKASPCVTLSIGCASYPKDAANFEDTFKLADFAMYRAKENGRNRYVIFNPALHGAADAILQNPALVRRTNRRGDLSVGDLICDMLYRSERGDLPDIDTFLDELVTDLSIQRAMLFAGEPPQIVAMAGDSRPQAALIAQSSAYLSDPALLRMTDKYGMMVCNDTEELAAKQLPIYDDMHRLSILSCVQIRGVDADNVPFVLSLDSVHHRVTWNPEHLKYYSLLKHVLHTFHLQCEKK